MNKYLKPKNFIKTLQFKQRKEIVYFIFQTQISSLTYFSESSKNKRKGSSNLFLS